MCSQLCPHLSLQYPPPLPIRALRHCGINFRSQDHTKGLGARWDRGLIYCTQVTARLVEKRLKVQRSQWSHRALSKNANEPYRNSYLTTCTHLNSYYCNYSQKKRKISIRRLQVSPEFLRPLPCDRPVTVEGVQVTLLDANHCPGAAMVVFERSGMPPVLHSGAFIWLFSVELSLTAA